MNDKDLWAQKMSDLIIKAADHMTPGDYETALERIRSKLKLAPSMTPEEIFKELARVIENDKAS